MTDQWQRVDADHYRAKLDSGTYEARRIDGAWTLWFQANYTQGFLRRPGCWPHLASAKQRAKVLDGDHYLGRSS